VTERSVDLGLCPNCGMPSRPGSVTCSNACTRGMRLRAKSAANNPAELARLREYLRRVEELKDVAPSEKQQAMAGRLGGTASGESRRIQAALKNRRAEKHPTARPMGQFTPDEPETP
jgi:hypothetical protein